MVSMPHGGVARRPGTEFLGEVKSSSVKTRLIPFQFKTSDTYILEFGDSVMRVFRNGQQNFIINYKDDNRYNTSKSWCNNIELAWIQQRR